MEAWTDERLDDLAATLRPLPAQMARVEERLEHLSERMDDLGENLGKRMDDQLAEMRAMRQDMSAFQRQFAQQGWAMSFALIGTVVALIVSVA